MSKPLKEQLAYQNDIIIQLQRELAAKDMQLKLLPDLEKKANEKHFEVEALHKQISALQKPWWKKLLSKTMVQSDRIAS
jgi:hypothetical protein